MRRLAGSEFPDNGFEIWGGYMNAKISKLDDQFADKAKNEENRTSNIFNGVSIFVNGYTKPSADQLKCLMSEHGGIYHHYFRSNKTKYIIASNLPDTKIKNLPTTKIIKPEWITDSIDAGTLLDYKNYILYTDVSKTQPRLAFKTDKTINNDTIENKDLLGSNYDHNESDKNVFKNPKPSTSVKAETNDSVMKTAVDPKFLDEYYGNSRLHHISQLGAGFKQYVNDLRNKSDFDFPLRKTLNEHTDTINSLNEFKDKNIIMHIDMDCFFVSVGLRNNPSLKGQPVAVTHGKNSTKTENQHHRREGVDVKMEFEMYSEKRKKNLLKNNPNSELNKKSTSNHGASYDDPKDFGSFSEIASCSYEARAMGLRNGMFMGEALRLCPNLKTIPYDFKGYKEVAFVLYDTIAQYTLDIEAVSCDEMYVDCTELLQDVGLTPLEFATMLRNEIKNKTKCPCSVGFGENRLQARLATKKAKPDGQFQIKSEDAKSYFADIDLRDLPGVGRQMQYKLNALGFSTCKTLWNANLNALKKNLGDKTGQLLYNYSRGIDDRPLNFNTIRKSISAGANYGIRFTDNEQCTNFLKQLCQEVHKRMSDIKVNGKSITLKLMIRAADAPVETAKFMGHGICDNITKTANLTEPTNDLNIIIFKVLDLCKMMNVKPEEMRGISIQISKLESLDKKPDYNIKQFFNKKTDDTNPFKEKSTIVAKTAIKTEENTVIKKKSDNIVKAEKKIFVPGLSKRRGRPPKNSSLNTKIIIPETHTKRSLPNSKMNVKKKVQPKKEVINKNKNPDVIESLEDIDLEVLNALPDDIRREILANYKKKSTSATVDKINDVKTVLPCNSEVDPGIIRECKDENILDASDPNINILNMDWKDVCEMLRIWMDSDSSPLGCDVNLINTYLKNLVITRKIEDVYSLINLVYRTSYSSGRCDWHRVYREMVESIQESMLMMYEKRMALFNKFECCDQS